MGIFRNSRQPVLKSSSYRLGRPSRRLPRGLVVFLIGIGLGVGGLLFLQTNYGPQRLSLEQSEQLRIDLSAAHTEQDRLKAELNTLRQEQQTNGSVAEQLATAQSHIATLKNELSQLLASIPDDPRGGPVGIRSALFKRSNNQLNYHILVMRNPNEGAALDGQLLVAIDGTFASGKQGSLNLDPIAITLDKYSSSQGDFKLPPGFIPKIVSVRVIDSAKKQAAVRVFYVRE